MCLPELNSMVTLSDYHLTPVAGNKKGLSHMRQPQ